jgi:hypothetical protein
MFERFPSLTRFSQGWTVTEKLDGTNAQIIIVPANEVAAGQVGEGMKLGYNAASDLVILAGSRNRLINTSADNNGFARFVSDNAQDLIEALGEGRHFGEWWGSGIQRNYGLKEKRFSLFNASRWIGPKQGGKLPDRVDVVPIIINNEYLGNPAQAFDEAMNGLKTMGSHAAPGFMNPEGIVMHHRASGTTFKKTFDYDEAGKWAENQANKEV